MVIRPDGRTLEVLRLAVRERQHRVVHRLAQWSGSVSLIVVGGSEDSRTSSSSDAPDATPPRRFSDSGTTSSDVGDQQPQRARPAGLPDDTSKAPGASAADAHDTRRTGGL